MKLIFTIKPPSELSLSYRKIFLRLLIEQGQVSNPNIENIENSKLLCLVHYNRKAIAIGAIKHVTKSAFKKAGVPDQANKFNEELGYVFVKPNLAYRGLGIGKMVCRLLLKELGKENVFATTDVGTKDNNMVGILRSLSFEMNGRTYKGAETAKSLGLFLKYQK